ncbi:hypothetical protein V1506DRAFT_510212 [Lipomyces tetrasporus]
MSLVKDENALSDFDKALSLLKNNPQGQRLDQIYFAREHLSSNGGDFTLIRNSGYSTMKGTCGSYIRSKNQADGIIVLAVWMPRRKSQPLSRSDIVRTMRPFVGKGHVDRRATCEGLHPGDRIWLTNHADDKDGNPKPPSTRYPPSFLRHCLGYKKPRKPPRQQRPFEVAPSSSGHRWFQTIALKRLAQEEFL